MTEKEKATEKHKKKEQIFLITRILLILIPSQSVKKKNLMEIKMWKEELDH